jgi:sugar/nucleoside kinase (ribokinase family)
VRLVGVVGDDFAAKDISRYEARGICLRGLQRDASGPTFYWHGRYHENFSGRDTLDIRLGVFEKFLPELPEDYRDTPFVLLGNIAPALQSHVLDSARKPKLVVADSMDLWINITKDDLLALMKRVDVFIVNDSEAEMLTGEKNAVNAGRKLRTMGPKTVIVKKGEHGSILFHEDGLCALPAYPVTELHDPTGAGDSFAGAFIGYLAAHDRTDFTAMRTALAYATVTASLTVEAFSCDCLESAGHVEIQRRLDTLRSLVTL